MIILTTKGKTYMKNFMIAAALGTATLTTPAFAGDFSGPRLEVTAGADDVTQGVDPTDVTYGAGLGYDLQLGKVVVGVEATADNVFDRRDIGVAGRLGYTINDNVLLYGKAGYSNWRQVRGVDLEGLRLGGGLEVNLLGPVYSKVEYRYTDFDGSVGKHGGLVGVGLRF
jgi:outer membrane immunogenic protein